MEESTFVRGGAFLVESIFPREVFTPEDFTEEQRLIGKAATEFVVGEVQPQMDDIEAQKEGLLPSLVKKAGELGFLSGDIAEEYEGQELDKVREEEDPSWWPTPSIQALGLFLLSFSAIRIRRNDIYPRSPQER